MRKLASFVVSVDVTTTMDSPSSVTDVSYGNTALASACLKPLSQTSTSANSASLVQSMLPLHKHISRNVRTTRLAKLSWIATSNDRRRRSPTMPAPIAIIYHRMRNLHRRPPCTLHPPLLLQPMTWSQHHSPRQSRHQSQHPALASLARLLISPTRSLWFQKFQQAQVQRREEASSAKATKHPAVVALTLHPQFRRLSEASSLQAARTTAQMTPLTSQISSRLGMSSLRPSPRMWSQSLQSWRILPLLCSTGRMVALSKLSLARQGAFRSRPHRRPLAVG